MKDLSKERVSPEVAEKAKRRQFSSVYKLRILSEADSCTRLGEVGKLLRREGLYSSHLANWRKQRKEGRLDGLPQKKRGRKEKPRDKIVLENKQLLRKTKRLEERLRKAELIIDVQKKVSALLGIPIEGEDEKK